MNKPMILEKNPRQVIYQIGRNLPLSAIETTFNRLVDPTNNNVPILQKLRQEAIYERVVLQIAHNVKALTPPGETNIFTVLVDALQDIYDKRYDLSKYGVPTTRAQLIPIFQEVGTHVLFIKGASFLHGYPNNHVRQLGDLDLIFKSWDDFFIAAQTLLKQGWSLLDAGNEAPWISRVSLKNASELQMRTHMVIINGDVGLDCHVEPFAIGITGTLVSQMWQRAQSQQTFVPTREDRLLLLIAHAMNHGYFLIKDFNDTYAILHEDSHNFDWDYFCYYAHKSVFAYAAYYTLNQIRQMYSSECVSDDALQRLQKDRRKLYAKVIPRTTEASKRWGVWAERTMHVVHTHAFEQSRNNAVKGLVKGVAFIRWIMQISILQTKIGSNPLVQRLFHKTGSKLFPLPSRGQQLFVVPVEYVCEDFEEEQQAACLQLKPAHLQEALTQHPHIETLLVGHTALFLRLGQGELIFTVIGVFVPTRDGVFNVREFEETETLLSILVESCARLSNNVKASLV